MAPLSVFSADTVILVGGANTSHFPILAQKELEGARKVHLGVRNLAGADENLVSFVSQMSSDSETVQKCANELRQLFLKNQNHPIARKDLKKIFGRRGILRWLRGR